MSRERNDRQGHGAVTWTKRLSGNQERHGRHSNGYQENTKKLSTTALKHKRELYQQYTGLNGIETILAEDI